VTNPTYKNFTHFHYLTGNRFQKRSAYGTFLPADTHSRHQWTWRSLGNHLYDSECYKCSAKRPVHIDGKDWS
jgi:hypothetical protein